MEFKIEKVKIYDLEESSEAAGYPMSLDMDAESDLERLTRLGRAKIGSGHDCALKGVIVNMDVTAPQYWWQQFKRYHFADIVSSQSTMHRIHKFDIKSQCNKYVSDLVVRLSEQDKEIYNDNPTKDNYMRLISNLPQGFNLGARLTTNYLQLKGIHGQRRKHKLPEWHIFCDWIETLPEMYKILKK